ncbi:WecB/TagA/CpsF family glycosyltransferase [candidate division KSB1 bacterium]|nr:WecB/TagA/CpsF family glycosyltransferase [candidate division KSB1 bacterium]
MLSKEATIETISRKGLFQGDRPHTADILGVRVDLVDYDETMGKIDNAIRYKSKITIGFSNVYTVMCSQYDHELYNAINGFSLSVADGMPLVWLSKFTDTPLQSRVYGPDLFLHVCARSEEKKYRHFFYGSETRVLDLLEENLTHHFPKLHIAGKISPPFRPLSAHEEQHFIDEINNAHADILWIAIGSPKQEKWMARVRPLLNVPVLAAVGAAFDFHAHTKRQAPPSIRNHGFEWLFRLLYEPRRLWMRYLIYNPLFVLSIMRRVIRKFLQVLRT